MLIYNKDTVLLWVHVPEKDSIHGIGSDGKSRIVPTYCRLCEYGSNGKTYLIGKDAIKRIMREGAMPARYPGMKVDVCNYTLTSDDRLVSAGNRKFNEYKEHPELLYDTVLGINYGKKDTEITQEKAIELLNKNYEVVICTLENKLNSLLKDKNSSLTIRISNREPNYTLPPFSESSDRQYPLITYKHNNGSTSPHFYIAVKGHKLGRAGFTFNLRMISSKVNTDYIVYNIKMCGIHSPAMISRSKYEEIPSSDLYDMFRSLDSMNISFAIAEKVDAGDKNLAIKISEESVNTIIDALNTILNYYDEKFVSKMTNVKTDYPKPIDIRTYKIPFDKFRGSIHATYGMDINKANAVTPRDSLPDYESRQRMNDKYNKLNLETHNKIREIHMRRAKIQNELNEINSKKSKLGLIGCIVTNNSRVEQLNKELNALTLEERHLMDELTRAGRSMVSNGF